MMEKLPNDLVGLIADSLDHREAVGIMAGLSVGIHKSIQIRYKRICQRLGIEGDIIAFGQQYHRENIKVSWSLPPKIERKVQIEYSGGPLFKIVENCIESQLDGQRDKIPINGIRNIHVTAEQYIFLDKEGFGYLGNFKDKTFNKVTDYKVDHVAFLGKNQPIFIANDKFKDLKCTKSECIVLDE